jgi:hypothetical protein
LDVSSYDAKTCSRGADFTICGRKSSAEAQSAKH